VGATVIDAPSLTRNEAKARDPEMLFTKTGNDWYFGMKAHVGVDVQRGIVHGLNHPGQDTGQPCLGRAAAR